MGWFSKKDKPPDKVGGALFFLSLLTASLVAAVHLAALPFLLFSLEGALRMVLFVLAAFIGLGAGWRLVPERIAVFIHELKHSIPSNLVGNRDRGMKIYEDSGEFRYAYSSATAKYNALIALAPYFLPLAAPAAVIISCTALHDQPIVRAVLAGSGLGLDLALNLREISPHQTDFQVIRGGLRVALWYILAVNLAWMTVLAAWAIADQRGLIFLVEVWWNMGMRLVIANPVQT